MSFKLSTNTENHEFTKDMRVGGKLLRETKGASRNKSSDKEERRNMECAQHFYLIKAFF